MKVSKKTFLTLASTMLILTGVFLFDLAQKFSLEHVSTKEALIRYTICCQDLRTDSSSYGGFSDRCLHVWKGYGAYLMDTYRAVELLRQLDALDRINTSALITFLNRSDISVRIEGGCWRGSLGEVYEVLTILKAVNRLDLADSLINLTAVRQVILLPPIQEYASAVFIADFLGWSNDINRTYYAERLYFEIKHYFHLSSAYDPNRNIPFNWLCYRIRALSILGGASTCVSDLRELNDFNYALTCFLLMRWDAYNGGFDSHPWGYLSTKSSDPQQIVATLGATYEGILTAKAIGMNLVAELHGTKEGLRQAFERLVERCQTPYGFYVNSPSKHQWKPWKSYEVQYNLYAVSILNLSGNNQTLEKGNFRWPPDAETFAESLDGYFIPFVVTISALPTIILLSKRKHKGQKENKKE